MSIKTLAAHGESQGSGCGSMLASMTWCVLFHNGRGVWDRVIIAGLENFIPLLVRYGLLKARSFVLSFPFVHTTFLSLGRYLWSCISPWKVIWMQSPQLFQSRFLLINCSIFQPHSHNIKRNSIEIQRSQRQKEDLVHHPWIEHGPRRWQRRILPLDQWC